MRTKILTSQTNILQGNSVFLQNDLNIQEFFFLQIKKFDASQTTVLKNVFGKVRKTKCEYSSNSNKLFMSYTQGLTNRCRIGNKVDT